MAPLVLPWQQPWQPLLGGGTTPTCLLPIRRTPPTRPRTGPSSPPPRRTTCTTPQPPARTSSPWWQEEEEAAVTRAHRRGSCRRAPMPPQAPPSCTHLCPIRMKEWVWRWSLATVAPQQTWQLLKPCGDLTEPATVVEDTLNVYVHLRRQPGHVMEDNPKQDKMISVKWRGKCGVILLLSQVSSLYNSSITWPGARCERPLWNHLLTNNVGHWKTRMTDRCISQQRAESGPPSLTLRTPERSEGRAERSGLTFWFYTDRVHAAALDWSEISFLCKITRLLPHKCCWCREKICSCQILWTACLFLPSSIIVTLLHCHRFFFSVRHF